MDTLTVKWIDMTRDQINDRLAEWETSRRGPKLSEFTEAIEVQDMRIAKWAASLTEEDLIALERIGIF